MVKRTKRDRLAEILFEAPSPDPETAARFRADFAEADQIASDLLGAMRSRKLDAFNSAAKALREHPLYFFMLPVVVSRAAAEGASVWAESNARVRNAEHKRAAILQWEKAKIEGCSKAAFARSFAALLKTTHGVEITDREISTRWLKGK
jgi:hypothetical protein